MKTQGGKKSTYLRNRFLITLSRADLTEERRAITLEQCISRILSVFRCNCVLAVREHHKKQGSHHFHIAVGAENANQKTFKGKIRNAFSEFTGASLHVKPLKSWEKGICYLLKDILPLLDFNDPKHENLRHWGDPIPWIETHSPQ